MLARAGAAVGYIYCAGIEDAGRACLTAAASGLNGRGRARPVGAKATGLESWAKPGTEIEIMRLIKQRFDPGLLLNRGRMFNQI